MGTGAIKLLNYSNYLSLSMNQSHNSLKDDYEVTGTELDTLVYEGRKLPGVIGTLMTGAGFGGCTISIVRKADSANFMTTLSGTYHKKTGLMPDFYQPEIGNGAGRIE
jgi:galactokinase